MRATIARLAPALRLTRITTAFAAVANVWFVVLWTRASDGEAGQAVLRVYPVWIQIIGGFIVAVGVYAFAAASNDVLDIRRDRALKRDRPIATGRISAESAVAVVSGSLVGVGLGASVFGLWSVRLAMGVCLGSLFYNFAARHFPSARIVLLGLLYAAHMLIPNPRMEFVWPIWVVMTHALAVSAVTHVQAGARPRLTRGSIIAATAGWIFWSVVLFWVGVRRTGGIWPAGVSGMGAMLVAALAAVFSIVVWRVTRRGKDPETADRVLRLGAFWLALYGGAWLLGEGFVAEGLGITAVAVAGFAVAIAVHEVAARLDEPLDYRLK